MPAGKGYKAARKVAKGAGKAARKKPSSPSPTVAVAKEGSSAQDLARAERERRGKFAIIGGKKPVVK